MTSSVADGKILFIAIFLLKYIGKRCGCNTQAQCHTLRQPNQSYSLQLILIFSLKLLRQLTISFDDKEGAFTSLC